jgi:NAD(P) transhydrogenase subunit beta
MLSSGTVFLQTTNFIDVCYIIAFGLMIYGLMGLTGPRTAVRGNKIAAAGMAIAVIATLLRKGEFDGSATVWLILAGLVIGTAVGVPAAPWRSSRGSSIGTRSPPPVWATGRCGS